MSALVSMHGIWFLVAFPLAAALAWRLHGPKLLRIVTYLSVLAAVGLCGWFGFLTIQGAEFTETFYDRVMNSIGIIIGSIDVPVVQFLSAAAAVICWPRSWTYRKPTKVEAPDIELGALPTPSESFEALSSKSTAGGT